MEKKLKIIKIQQPNNKQLYKDILSSSKKVHEIIKKTKINKSKFYKSRVHKKQTYSPENYIQQPLYPINDIKDPIKELEKIVYKKAIHPPPYKLYESLEEPINVSVVETFKEHVTEPISNYNLKTNKTCINNNYFKHEPTLTLEKKTHKKNIVGTYKSKKIKDYKPNNSLNYCNNSKKITMKIFTQKEIDKFINVLSYYSNYDHYVKIHKYIKKLNKYQTIQILYELNLIQTKSKAPLKILKNILYNYFFCSINIIRL